MTDRAALATRFLVAAGWGGAGRQALQADASARSYTRLTRAGGTAILMDAPPGSADDPADFVIIAAHLARHGFSVPKVLAQDLAAGFLLLEDFGEARFAGLMAADPSQSGVLYTAATDALCALAQVPLLPGLPDLSAAEWADAAGQTLPHYAEQADLPALTQALARALAARADGPRILIHRDFHAENLMLLAGRTGRARVGLLDFQAAQAGQPGYDLVSLLQDARRDVSPLTEAAMIARYASALALDPGAFAASYAALGAQRALRILGVFARLAAEGKPRYLAFLPRVRAQLQRNLAHPALQDLRAACAVLPAP